MGLKENTAAVFTDVAHACQEAGRPENAVTIVAVTKYVDSSIINQLLDAGVSHIGENRADVFLDKYQKLKDRELTWHFIGSLQRRKVKDLINAVDYFHGLDSVRLAAEIDKRADRPVKCFLQVNISGEASKHGFRKEELSGVLPQLAQFSKIELVGLMTMAPLGAAEAEILQIFRETEDLRREIQAQAWKNMPMTELSMGMSQDYRLAIQAGASFVRIGTAFFK